VTNVVARVLRTTATPWEVAQTAERATDRVVVLTRRVTETNLDATREPRDAGVRRPVVPELVTCMTRGGLVVVTERAQDGALQRS
jgi:hypothetical protein